VETSTSAFRCGFQQFHGFNMFFYGKFLGKFHEFHGIPWPGIFMMNLHRCAKAPPECWLEVGMEKWRHKTRSRRKDWRMVIYPLKMVIYSGFIVDL
jgi:hypothetical protein